MKSITSILTLCATCLLTGCTLNQQVPKATIVYDSKTGAINIASHKDVKMSNIEIEYIQGQSTKVTIGSYDASANVEVVRSAVIAQKQQMDAIQEGLKNILDAATKSSTPVGALLK